MYICSIWVRYVFGTLCVVHRCNNFTSNYNAVNQVNNVVMWGKPHFTWLSSNCVPLFTLQLTMVNVVVVCGEPHLTCPASDRLPHFTIEATMVNAVVINGQPHFTWPACQRWPQFSWLLENYATLHVVGGSRFQVSRCHIWWITTQSSSVDRGTPWFIIWWPFTHGIRCCIIVTCINHTFTRATKMSYIRCLHTLHKNTLRNVPPMDSHTVNLQKGQYRMMTGNRN